jgi:hypothetical protein
VPGAFQLLAGPIGAGGPDGLTDHSFATIQMATAQTRCGPERALKEPGLGLPANFPGCATSSDKAIPMPQPHPRRSTSRRPTPSTMIVEVAEDANLTVTAGASSYQQNTFPQDAIEATPILGFRLCCISRAVCDYQPHDTPIADRCAGAGHILQKAETMR